MIGCHRAAVIARHPALIARHPALIARHRAAACVSALTALVALVACGTAVPPRPEPAPADREFFSGAGTPTVGDRLANL